MTMDNLNLIVKMKFGSHLYGTDTPDSDLDYKGVFMPTMRQIFLAKVPKAHNITTKNGDGKNTSEDIDTEIYSLHYFIELACQGQTVALDMLHAPDNMIIEKSNIWDYIIKRRETFYTKNLKAFIGYARRQASKYGIKGSRLNTVEYIINFLKFFDQDKRLSEIWNLLHENDLEHIHFLFDEKSQLRMYQVVGKKFQETAQIGYVVPILEKFKEEFGNRAKLAAENKGIDWKAISHALRAAFQVKQLLTENTITFPLKESDLLRNVKQGKHDYLTFVAPLLEELMDEVETRAQKSDLPDKVNRTYWDNKIINLIKWEYSKSILEKVGLTSLYK